MGSISVGRMLATGLGRMLAIGVGEMGMIDSGVIGVIDNGVKGEMGELMISPPVIEQDSVIKQHLT